MLAAFFGSKLEDSVSSFLFFLKHRQTFVAQVGPGLIILCLRFLRADIICLLICVCVGGGTHMPHYMHRGQRKIFELQFPPSMVGSCDETQDVQAELSHWPVFIFFFFLGEKEG